jgi:putative heme iron utilization protein
VACDDRGRPLLCLSGLAEHTKNLEADERASLLITSDADGDPLALERMTLVGPCARVPAAEREGALARFLEVHPRASYAHFADFAMWRIEVVSVRWIGGFGAMQWVDPGEYSRALTG